MKKIIVLVRYTAKPGMRDAFLNKIIEEGILAATLKEDGCEKYDYYYPVGTEDDLCLCEIWRDADAVAAHGKQAHYLRLGELKAEMVDKVSVDKFMIEAM